MSTALFPVKASKKYNLALIKLSHIAQKLNSCLEQWHSANHFIFFGHQSELTSSRLEDQMISALSLQPLQNRLIYVNTIMVQDVLDDPSPVGVNGGMIQTLQNTNNVASYDSFAPFTPNWDI